MSNYEKRITGVIKEMPSEEQRKVFLEEQKKDAIKLIEKSEGFILFQLKEDGGATLAAYNLHQLPSILKGIAQLSEQLMTQLMQIKKLEEENAKNNEH